MTSPTPMSRVKRSKAEAKANYDRLSRWYDLLAGQAERKCRETALARLDVREGEAVLEVGCGTGQCLPSLFKASGASGRVFGVDLSQGMLAVAQDRVRAAGAAEKVGLICGDAAQMPFRVGSFEAILVTFTLELFDTPEIPVVLEACQRLLRPGGRICLAVMSKERGGWAARVYEWFHDRLPQTVDCRPIYVQGALEQAGFRIVSVTEMMMFGLPVDVVLAAKF